MSEIIINRAIDRVKDALGYISYHPKFLVAAAHLAIGDKQ
jgi:hypothetical protein